MNDPKNDGSSLTPAEIANIAEGNCGDEGPTLEHYETEEDAPDAGDGGCPSSSESSDSGSSDSDSGGDFDFA